jgi:spore germination protein PE
MRRLHKAHRDIELLLHAAGRHRIPHALLLFRHAAGVCYRRRRIPCPAPRCTGGGSLMSLQCRNTTLGNLFVNSVSSSSIVQLGDNDYSNLSNKVLAVQRAIPNFEDDEYRFASYRIFYLPKLTLQPNVAVAFQSRSPLPNIQVGSVEMLGVTAASYLRVGCGGPLVAESRILDIRHFNNQPGSVAEK